MAVLVMLASIVRPGTTVRAWVLAGLLCGAVTASAFAQELPAADDDVQAAIVYTAADTLAAVEQYSAEFGIRYAYLRSIVRCETGGTYDPYARGKLGELGAVQLHPRGELQRFLSWGYDDPDDPYQAVRFLAQRLNQGTTAWSCA